jgi:hypothetical protein
MHEGLRAVEEDDLVGLDDLARLDVDTDPIKVTM